MDDDEDEEETAGRTKSLREAEQEVRIRSAYAISYVPLGIQDPCPSSVNSESVSIAHYTVTCMASIAHYTVTRLADDSGPGGGARLR